MEDWDENEDEELEGLDEKQEPCEGKPEPVTITITEMTFSDGRKGYSLSYDYRLGGGSSPYYLGEEDKLRQDYKNLAKELEKCHHIKPGKITLEDRVGLVQANLAQWRGG